MPLLAMIEPAADEPVTMLLPKHTSSLFHHLHSALHRHRTHRVGLDLKRHADEVREFPVTEHRTDVSGCSLNRSVEQLGDASRSIVD